MAENEVAVEGGIAAAKAVSKKTIFILGGVFVLEGLAITAVFLLAGGPTNTGADGPDLDLIAAGEKPFELRLVDDKFPNTLSGRTYLYETEIFIKIRQKHQEDIEQKLETMAAQIKADVAEIFRAAEPSHLRETSLATIKRQIRARLAQRLGRDVDGGEYIEEILIPRCTQFRADM